MPRKTQSPQPLYTIRPVREYSSKQERTIDTIKLLGELLTVKDQEEERRVISTPSGLVTRRRLGDVIVVTAQKYHSQNDGSGTHRIKTEARAICAFMDPVISLQSKTPGPALEIVAEPRFLVSTWLARLTNEVAKSIQSQEHYSL